MTEGARGRAAARQVPDPGALTLDHVAHFVPDADAASAALEQLGFTLTPFSAQSHRLQKDGPLVPAGTGNRCVMLEDGYLEFLTPFAATPVADQLRAAMQRYVGVHLIAFGTAAPDLDHARLSKQGYEPLAPVALQRPISTPTGEDTARFTVVRVPPGTMAEGRIQFCQHHTPDLVWQARWVEHGNGARALAAVFVCVEDPDEAAQRYSRYAGLPSESEGRSRRIRTTRGTLVFAEPRALEKRLGVSAPALPWIAGYALDCRDIAAARAAASRSGSTLHDLDGGRFCAVLPAALGGVIVFQEPRAPLLRFD